MDLDAYVSAHRPSWERLGELARKRRLTGPEADELTGLYQLVATHLSVIRSGAPDAGVIAYLSALLAHTRARAGRPGTLSRELVAEAIVWRFPAALYRTRRWWLGAMAASYAVAAAVTVWLLQNPQVESRMMSPEQAQQIVNSDFEGYYSSSAASHFAAQVWTNNAYVSALCVALGVFGFPVIYLLWENMLNLAVMASLMIRHDRAGLFFGLITPHGLLELTAVFIAAGTGLRLMWAWVSPGDRSRSASLSREGRSAGGVVLGLVAVLLISGIIEGFVTPSGLPTWARVAIGVLAEVLFLSYVFILGRRAVRAGHDGDLRDEVLADRVATAG